MDYSSNFSLSFLKVIDFIIFFFLFLICTLSLTAVKWTVSPHPKVTAFAERALRTLWKINEAISWGPNPTGLVTSQKEEGRTLSEHGEAGCLKARKGPHRKLTMLTSWSGTSSVQNCETIHFWGSWIAPTPSMVLCDGSPRWLRRGKYSLRQSD